MDGHSMDGRRFNRFLARLRRQLAKLSRQQLAHTKELIAELAARWECLETIEAYGRLRRVCPHWYADGPVEVGAGVAVAGRLT